MIAGRARRPSGLTASYGEALRLAAQPAASSGGMQPAGPPTRGERAPFPLVGLLSEAV